MPDELVTIGRGASAMQVPADRLRSLFLQLGINPVLTIDAVPHYSAADMARAQQILARTPPDVLAAEQRARIR